MLSRTTVSADCETSVSLGDARRRRRVQGRVACADDVIVEQDMSAVIDQAVVGPETNVFPRLIRDYQLRPAAAASATSGR